VIDLPLAEGTVGKMSDTELDRDEELTQEDESENTHQALQLVHTYGATKNRFLREFRPTLMAKPTHSFAPLSEHATLLPHWVQNTVPGDKVAPHLVHIGTEAALCVVS